MQTEFEAINHSVNTQREAEYNAKIEQRRAAEVSRWLMHVQPVADILRGWKHNVELAVNRQSFTVDGIDCSWLIEIKAEYTGTTWRSHPTGKLRMTVGDYGNRVSYKQRNDGTFSYEKVAEKILAHVVHKIDFNDSMDRRKTNKAIINQFRKDNGLSEYGWFTNSDDLDKPIRISFNLTRNMTVDQAVKLVEALKIAGIKPY